MRRTLTARFVLVAAVLALLGAAVFAAISNLPEEGPRRTDVVLGLDTDLDNGRIIYTTTSQPSCASCHTLADAGAVSDRASSLDVLLPSARETIDSLLAGTVRAHDAQGYEHHLTNQEMADLATYIEEVAGN